MFITKKDYIKLVERDETRERQLTHIREEQIRIDQRLTEIVNNIRDFGRRI